MTLGRVSDRSGQSFAPIRCSDPVARPGSHDQPLPRLVGQKVDHAPNRQGWQRRSPAAPRFVDRLQAQQPSPRLLPLGRPVRPRVQVCFEVQISANPGDVRLKTPIAFLKPLLDGVSPSVAGAEIHGVGALGAPRSTQRVVRYADLLEGLQQRVQQPPAVPGHERRQKLLGHPTFATPAPGDDDLGSLSDSPHVPLVEAPWIQRAATGRLRTHLHIDQPTNRFAPELHIGLKRTGEGEYKDGCIFSLPAERRVCFKGRGVAARRPSS